MRTASGSGVLFDFAPQFAEVEQPLGNQERGDHLPQRRAFLVGEVERDARPEAVDEAVGDLGREDLVAQPVGADRLFVRLAHGLGKGVEQLRLHQLSWARLQLFGRVLQRKLGHRQHHGKLGPGKAAILLSAANQVIGRCEALDLAVEPARSLEDLDRPHLAWKRPRPAALGDRQRERLQPVVLEHQVGDVVGHPDQQRVALVEREPALAHFAIERDLDVDLVVRAIDASAIVDEIGVDPPAILGEFDPPGLGDGEVGAFADDLGAELAGVGAERVIGRVADLRMALARRFDVGADPAEPDQVDRALEDGVDQAGGIAGAAFDASASRASALSSIDFWVRGKIPPPLDSFLRS